MSKRFTEVLAVLDRSSPAFGAGEEASVSGFAPDILTPAQYYPAPISISTPYHRLLLAILEDAIRCYQRTLGAKGARQSILFRETREWLFDSRTTMMSCPMVCEHLGIDASRLRRYLRTYTTKSRVGEKPRRLPRRAALFA